LSIPEHDKATWTSRALAIRVAADSTASAARGGSQLVEWKTAIAAGQTTKFGANLYY